MTRDCYSILGVAPAAEDVVIGAAYRALMRHYHPDTNADPEAQARAREITAAYALLRDPAKRAAYDAGRAAGEDLWASDEPPPVPVRAAAGRGPAIAASFVALTAVATLWAWPPNQEVRSASQPIVSVTTAAGHASPKTTHTRPDPPLALEPEHERLARLRSQIAPSPAPPLAGVDEIAVSEPAPTPPKPLRSPSAKPARLAAATPNAAVTQKAVTPAATPRTAKDASEKPKTATAAGDAARLATLDRLSTGFYGQSLVNADSAKKQLLISARGRFAAQRNACHSDSCVANTYLAHMREISTIMERRAPAAKK